MNVSDKNVDARKPGLLNGTFVKNHENTFSVLMYIVKVG